MESKILTFYIHSLIPDHEGFMNREYSQLLQEQIQKWSSSKIEPLFAPMKKSKAIDECISLILDSWNEKHKKELIFFIRTSVHIEDLLWSFSLERKCILENPSNLSEALYTYDKLLDHDLMIGPPFRLRDLKKETFSKILFCKQPEIKLLFRDDQYIWHTLDNKQEFIEAKQLHNCSYFIQIPNTNYLLGTEKNKLYLSKLGEKNCFACLETSIKDIDYLDYEIIPCGSIVITVGKRNLNTGGLLQTECMAFRLDNSTLITTSLTKEEAEEAEKESLKDIILYDFNYKSSPLSAYTINPWKSQVIFKDSIINEFEFGTIIGIYGIPNDYKIIFASGIYIHVKNNVIIQKLDLGYCCLASIYFKS